MRMYFVARALGTSWPDVADLADDDVDAQAARFRGGVNNWIVPTFLRLRTRLLANGITSTLGELPRPDAKLLMHDDDALARGLEEGDLVRIFNDQGEVHCPVNVVPSIRPGTVSLPKGLWRRSTRNGFTATVLAPDTLTDLGGGACFNDARVQVASLAIA